jgi:hypothetical protein
VEEGCLPLERRVLRGNLLHTRHAGQCTGRR